MKSITLFLSFFFACCSLAQETDSMKIIAYDPSFHQYLNGLKLTCLDKDTARLHALIGNEAFGYSCYGGESPYRGYPTDWLIFANHFGLLKDPSTSEFWNFFLRISEDGFYTDGFSYEIPASHSWKTPYPFYPETIDTNDQDVLLKYAAINFELYGLSFLSDTVSLFVGETLSDAVLQQFIPARKNADNSYPYHFTQIDGTYYECTENGNKIGFVAEKELIYWNFHFLFRKINDQWRLDYYEVCN